MIIHVANTKMQILKATTGLVLVATLLAGCASGKKPPEITYDNIPIPAALTAEKSASTVEIVER